MNLSTEENFREAIKMAKERDDERAQALEDGEADDLPLMHGIPMSIKDLINQKGKLSTVGCAYLCDDRAKDDGAIVKLYLKHGAIPIVRGNCP